MASTKRDANGRSSSRASLDDTAAGDGASEGDDGLSASMINNMKGKLAAISRSMSAAVWLPTNCAIDGCSTDWNTIDPLAAPALRERERPSFTAVPPPDPPPTAPATAPAPADRGVTGACRASLTILTNLW
jgi:hypothetical protein